MMVSLWSVVRLEYKYSRLVMSANKECELPAADSCALAEGEEPEDDVVYTQKPSLLGKLRAIANKVCVWLIFCVLSEHVLRASFQYRLPSLYMCSLSPRHPDFNIISVVIRLSLPALTSRSVSEHQAVSFPVTLKPET